MSHYLNIFVEAVLSTCWPVFSDLTFFAMLHFGNYAMGLATACAALGVAAATLLLWLAGRIAAVIYLKRASEKLTVRYTHLQQLWQRHGVYAALLIWMPAGFIIGIALGFLRLPLAQAISLSTIGAVLFYAAQWMLWAA